MKLGKWIYILLVGATWVGVASRAVSGSVLAENLEFSPKQWTTIQDQFENNIEVLMVWLENYARDHQKLELQITDLQNQRAQLQAQTNNQGNIFIEIRLKALLNKLQNELQEESDDNRLAASKQEDFEQECLSLIDLYNSHIEEILETGSIVTPPVLLNSKIDELSDLVRRRNRIQWILNHFSKKTASDELASLDTLSSFQSNDVETLQLTLDMLQDRQKNLKDQMEKWDLQLDSLRNEIKLQGEMKNFLKDIQDMNINSDFPQNSLNQEDLEFLSGNARMEKLISSLNEVQSKILKGEKLLAQIDQLISQTQLRLNSLSEGKKP